jgi:hypothetical protein
MSLKTKHTPAPWKVETMLGDSIRLPRSKTPDEFFANAKLAEAAPEMFEALHRAHEVLWNGYKPDSQAAESARNAILDAIAKATGGSHE